MTSTQAKSLQGTKKGCARIAGKKEPYMSENTVRGRISVHPRGFGFLNETSPRGGERRSIFISPPDLGPFFDGDVVDGVLGEDRSGRLSATSLELLERTRTEVFGEVTRRGNRFYLHPDPEVGSSDRLLKKGPFALREGDTVVARIEGDTLTAARKITKASEIGLERVIARHGLQAGFSDDVIQAAGRAASQRHTLGGRRDLRDLPTVTIDAPSTRDIDDAVSVIPASSDGALRLLISIADVSAFVEEGSLLDRAAAERGTSVYLSDRVLPMLPELLSTDRLSLLPGEERATLTVELRVDPEGRVLSTDIYESLIRSWARLTYDEMAAYLDRGELGPSLEPIRESLPWMRTANARLAVARATRGGVVLERSEARVTFDKETDAATGLEVVRSTSAHVMIERCMVAANEAVANWLKDRGVPVPFRVHDRPDPDRVADLAGFARQFDLAAGFDKGLSPLALAAFEHQIRGVPGEQALRSVMRRLLGPARYTVAASSHFGLAAPLYLHFTSPIRRYADLLVHRAVKRYLAGHREFEVENSAIEARAADINERAFRASRAEADRLRALHAELMANRIGEVHEARIVRIRPFGLVAQLEELGVEGTVPMDDIPGGPYSLEQRETVLSGRQRSFTLGAPITVEVTAADPAAGRIELALHEPKRRRKRRAQVPSKDTTDR